MTASICTGLEFQVYAALIIGDYLILRGGMDNPSWGLTLFVCLERDRAPVPDAPVDTVVWRWWAMMAPLMETNPDTSPVIEPVEEMFYFPG